MKWELLFSLSPLSLSLWTEYSSSLNSDDDQVDKCRRLVGYSITVNPVKENTRATDEDNNPIAR